MNKKAALLITSENPSAALPLDVQCAAWRSKNGHAKTNILNGVENSIAERDNGSSRSEHIVHQKEMFSTQRGGIADTKNTLDIIPAFGVVALRLTLIVAMAHNAVTQHLNTEFARYAIG